MQYILDLRKKLVIFTKINSEINMKSFKEIINALKLYLSDGKEIKVLDKDIATVLEINQARFATLKKRNVTPYFEILLYCQREKLSVEELFFG